MKKTIRELVNFLGTDNNMKFAMKNRNGISPKEYYNKEDFFKEYGAWANEVPVDWFPRNYEKEGTWYCLFII